MYWYDETGKESDVVVSSRIRFARNITDKPFMSRLNEMCIRDRSNTSYISIDKYKRLQLIITKKNNNKQSL